MKEERKGMKEERKGSEGDISRMMTGTYQTKLTKK